VRRNAISAVIEREWEAERSSPAYMNDEISRLTVLSEGLFRNLKHERDKAERLLVAFEESAYDNVLLRKRIRALYAQSRARRMPIP
jgi:hypothetical protein